MIVIFMVNGVEFYLVEVEYQQYFEDNFFGYCFVYVIGVCFVGL